MIFNSLAFAVFFACVFGLFWVVRNHVRGRVVLLLAASYFFYGYWDWRFLGLILFSTVLDFLVGKYMAASRDERVRKRLLICSLIGNLGVLGFFKYWGFFTDQLQTLLATVGMSADALTLNLILPVGISFYTFQTLSYTIDIYRRELEPEHDLLNFALFVAFFPQLVAGPIVRARDFLPQIAKPPKLTQERFDSGLALIFWGLVKKMVIADYLGSQLVDPFWEYPEGYGGWASLLGIYGYAFQIYGDFSGYSDCAIGIARLLGFDLCDNFKSPYRAVSPSDFWTRWHISLSSWLRDYLYIPLGGNRGGTFKTYRNLSLTMLLGGLWHGAAWMFVIWGAFHGLLLVIWRLAGFRNPRSLGGIWLMRVVMFQCVCLGWIFFRSETWGQMYAVLTSLFQPRGGENLPVYTLPVMALAVLTHLMTGPRKQRLKVYWERVPGLVQGVIYALVVGLLLNAGTLDTPFIYFQF